MRLKPTRQDGERWVIIIGGGFGGMKAAMELANKPKIRVLLLDKNNHHLFQPLLYQVATAGLNPADIAVPIRAQFSDAANVEVHLGKVKAINLAEKFIITENHEIEYDDLIIATGTQHNYFGHPEWETFAPGLKTLEQATEIRRRVLSAFELAENTFDPAVQKELLTFVVVGGGPTGVEMAGAIADIARTVLVKDFKHINPAQAHVVLVEASPKIMTAFDEKLAERAKHDLEEMGVEVRTSSMVQNINAEGVQIADQFLRARTVIWGAGVKAAPLQFIPEIPIDKAGRVKVQKDLSIPSYPGVYVVGDMASLELSPGQFLPGLAPAAMQAGRHAARNILRAQAGKPLQDFVYKDKGQMATIGKHRAIAQAGKLRMTGFIAWMAWLFVHVFYLVTFRNRLSVMTQWAWSYTFSKRGARLITQQEWKLST
ncbi:MAG TPA: NAD(P)/FAD-dependent oxidoreductase [Oligoflexus sp.]|uniref:NAD(P)/FAD-dependent oxidoreductase n=1 Tax=Oligoflexus sp. TaxID=1971216 RepID=UPI002D61368E|nr:NAD(P)/FAD-dependent oxidoreductase [Oligoflexus sp.]HYX33773.1 NAD(P)/FAD-dependent oxidoreductase [Oligoflexus sp.]